MNLYMCHGVPGVNFVGITREIFWDDDYGRHRLEGMFGKTRSDILIAGHTHQPLLLKTKAGIHFNPGSLYTLHPEFSSHSYGVLTLPQKEFEVFDILASHMEAHSPETYTH